MQGASPLHPFDLHVLSTPPAFILSQNQTLKFNLYKTERPKPFVALSRLFSHLSLLTLLWVLISQKNWQKLFLCYKKSFLSYSIFNLREPNNSPALTLSRGELAYYNKSALPLSSIFNNFFRFYSEVFSVFRYFVAFLLDSLFILSHPNLFVNDFQQLFFEFWRIFFCLSVRLISWDSLHIIALRKQEVNRFSSFFVKFFRLFLHFFCTTICCVFFSSMIQ